MIILASISSSSPPMLRRITRRPALERVPMGRGQICGRGGLGVFLGANNKSAPPFKLLGGGFFALSWICDFDLNELDDCCVVNTTADDFIIAEDFISASLGSDDNDDDDDGKMVDGHRDLIHFAPELGPGEV